MSELLPCPFCGSSALIYWSVEYGECAKCSNFDCHAHHFDVPVLSHEWNHRHTPAGWQLVPVEPTAGKMRALWQAEPLDRHAALLAAAPRPGGE